MERGFFEHVLDAFEGFIGDSHGTLHASAHRRGLKVWFGVADGSAAKEHYEAQLIRVDGDVALEIGYHAEYRSPPDNTAALDRLLSVESQWRDVLGDEAEAGPFIAMSDWKRISEVWPPPDPEDPETPMDIAGRLADYVDAIEPLRMSHTEGND